MPQTGLLRCSPRRMYHELLFCPVRLYGLQPLRRSFQSIILTLTALCFFFGSEARLRTAFLSRAALRTSTAPQLLSKYYPYPDCTLFFSSGRRLRHHCFFPMRLCGHAPDRPFDVFPSATVSRIAFLSRAVLRTSTAPQLLSKYYPYPDCTLFFSSGQRLGYELLFCLMRQYEQAPNRSF